MKLGIKILLSFLAVILLMASVNTAAVIQMKQIENGAVRMDQEFIAEANIAYTMRRHLVVSTYEMELFVYSNDEKHLLEAKQRLIGAKENIDEGQKLADQYPSLVVLREEMDKLETQIAVYEQFMEEIEESEQESRREYIGDLARYGQEMSKVADKIATIGMSRIQEESKNSMALVSKTSRFMYYGLLGVLLISITFAYFLSRRITAPIKKMQDILQKAEQGDLTVIADIKSNDEIGQLAESFHKMLGAQRRAIISTIETASVVQTSNQSQTKAMQELTTTMDEMARSVTEVAGNISDIADQMTNISESVDDLNLTIENVAASAGTSSETASEVTKSIIDITDSIHAVAQHSNVAKIEGEKTVTVTNQGKLAVEKTIIEMNQINEGMKALLEAIQGLGRSSLQIGEIIKVIENISEQTNLLALNASIEAARAGEHGKGFAVVASAISNLADKSRIATRDITDLIKSIQCNVSHAVDITKSGAEQVGSGVHMVRAAGEALDSISYAVQKTVGLITEIADSTEHQAKMSQVIAAGANKVNGLSEQVSTAAEEQLATIEEIVKVVGNVNVFAQAVAGASQQQSASSEEVLSTTQNVAELSKEMELQAVALIKSLSRFRVS